MKKLGIQLLIMFAAININAADYHIKWTQVTGATYDLPTYTITKNVNNSWNNCGAISSNYLKANTDGKVEFVVNNLTEKKAFGLSQYNTSPGLASLDYALYVNEGKLFVIENGAILGRYGNVSLNDALYIERVGSTIYYRQNKTTLRQVSTDPANILYADITIFAQGSSFNSGITASFAVDMSVTYDLVHVNCVTNTRGSISANITGGEAPFTYNWTTGGTSSQITDLKIGKFGVVINDYLGQLFKADFEVYNTTFWNNPTGANFSNDYFTKNTTDGWDNCGGVSYNGLNSGENGYITLKIDNNIGNKAIGLSNYSSQTGYLDINYCFFINGPKLDIVESGIVQGTFGTLADGDIVSIELNSGTIFYYLNGKEIRKVVESSSKKLFAKFSVYNQGETLEPVYSSFCFPEIELQSSNVHGQAYCSENVTLIPIGGYPPYSYLWPDGNTSQVRQDVSVGKYDITVSDNYSHSNHNMVAVNTMIQWTDLVGTTLNGEKLVKTGTYGWGTGGAASLNKLYTGENGFLTYTINHLGDVYCLGLSSVNTDANYTSINYGFMVDGSGKILIFENGEMKIPVSIAKAGDVLKIEKSGLDIKYFYNGANILTTNLKNNTSLIVDVALLKTNAYLDPVYVSFCPKPEIITDYTVSFDEDCNLGNVDLEVTGGVAPFTYLWSTGETTQDYSNKKGIYYVTVTDFAGTHKTVTVNLIPDIIWTDLVGIELQGDKLVKSAIKNWGNGGAASENMLFADQNGYIVYTVNEIGPKSFGLSPINRDAGYMSIEYSFYISNNGYEIIERGTLIGNYGKYAPEDQLKIEKNGRSINYWLNNKLIRATVINDPVNYIADVALFETGSYFEELYVSFCPVQPLQALYKTTPVTENSIGKVSLEISGGVAPYYIVWGEGSLPTLDDITIMMDTIPELDSLDIDEDEYYKELLSSVYQNTSNCYSSPGIYPCKVYDSNNEIIEFSIPVGRPLQFVNFAGIEVVGNQINKTGQSGWGTSFATSNNVVNPQKEFTLAFSVKNTNTIFAAGLRNNSLSQSRSYTDISDGIYINNGMLNIIEQGQIVSQSNSFNPGDIIKMISAAAGYNYYINTALVYSGITKPAGICALDYVINSVEENENNLPYGPTEAIAIYELYPLCPTIEAVEITNEEGCEALNTGGISVDINSNGYSITSIKWYNGETEVGTGPGLVNVTAGKYTLKITFVNDLGNSVTISRNYFVSRKLLFQYPIRNHFYSEEIEDYSDIATSGLIRASDVYGDNELHPEFNNPGGGTVTTKLEEAQSGWVEFDIINDWSPYKNDLFYFGLSESNEIVDNSFKYGIRLLRIDTYPYRLLKISRIINNFIIDESIGIVQESSVISIKIERDNFNRIVFYLNNQTITEFTINDASDIELVGKCLINSVKSIVENTRGNFSCNIQNELLCSELLPDVDNSKNYIKTKTPEFPVPDISEMKWDDVDRFDETITYFDGIGRKTQANAVKANSEKNDVVQLFEYDPIGRQSVEYLPYSSCTRGYFDNNALINQQSFYSAPPVNVASTNIAYSQNVYDNSPLNRIVEQGAPGEVWQLSAGHTKKVEYLTNNTNEVRKWIVNNSNGNCEYSGFYDKKELFVTKTIDENGVPKKEYKNKLGQVVLLNSYIEKPIEEAPETDYSEPKSLTTYWSPVSTYFIYDDFGLLRYVISPQGIEEMAQTDNWTSTTSPTFIDKWIFVKKYDKKQRMIENKIPGKEVEYYIYDPADRIIAMQDGNLRAENKWKFFKYDAFNRSVMSGITSYYIGFSRADMQLYVDNFIGTGLLFSLNEKRSQGTGSLMGYANSTFPNANNPGSEIMEVYYYDDYDFVNIENGFSNDFLFVSAEGYDEECYNMVNGNPTGSKIKVIGETDWINNVKYFDKNNREILLISSNQTGSADKVYKKYDFAGKLVASKTIHQNPVAGNIVINERNGYDHSGNLIQTFNKINDQPEIISTAFEYNAIGQLSDKRLYSENVAEPVYAQNIDFEYNVRGWLKKVNDVNNMGNDLFAFELNFENGNATLDAPGLFNGNISAMKWRTTYTDYIQEYGYQHDELNRIKQAKYKGSDVALVDCFTESGITYDNNGNILTLNRKGLVGETSPGTPQFGNMDQLSYFYIGNKLIGVDDEADDTGLDDFLDNGSICNDVENGTMNIEYSYDANGNMITDENKNINVVYNILNLPEIVDFGNNSRIEFDYTSLGIKTEKRVYQEGVLIQKKVYSNGFVYNDSQFEYMNTSEGRIVKNDGLFEYEYFLKDHRNNVYASFKKNNDGLCLLQENHYYLHGMTFGGLNYISSQSSSINKVTYQSQELSDDFGLNWYHFKWRDQNAQIGRFISVDPLASKFPWNSTYAFSENRIIDGVEFEGLETVSIHADARISLFGTLSVSVGAMIGPDGVAFFGTGGGGGGPIIGWSAGGGISFFPDAKIEDLKGWGVSYGTTLFFFAGAEKTANIAPNTMGFTISGGWGTSIGCFIEATYTITSHYSWEEIGQLIYDNLPQNLQKVTDQKEMENMVKNYYKELAIKPINKEIEKTQMALDWIETLEQYYLKMNSEGNLSSSMKKDLEELLESKKKYEDEIEKYQNAIKKIKEL